MAGKLDFVDVLLLQPYKKNAAVETTTVARVQNNALRDMANTSGNSDAGEQAGVLGILNRAVRMQFSCLSSRENRILLFKKDFRVICTELLKRLEKTSARQNVCRACQNFHGSQSPVRSPRSSRDPVGSVRPLVKLTA
jgi:hypothetical protein